MKEKVMEWCKRELNNIKRGYKAHDATTRCYGIVMFVTNELIGFESPEGQELVRWWDNEMLPAFRNAEFTEIILKKT